MMLRAVRTEFVKYFTTRLWWGMAIALFAIGAVFSGLIAFLSTSHAGDEPADFDLAAARGVYTVGWKMGTLLMLVIGVMFVGQEFRHRTITSTFLSFPRRAMLMAAKVLSMLLIGMFYGLVYLLGSVGVGGLVVGSNGFDPFPNPPQLLKTLGLLLLVLGLWALIGLGIGILIPSQIAAILITIAVAWIVEPILGMVMLLQNNWPWMKSLAKALPSNASTAVLQAGGGGGPMGADALGTWQLGLVVLICWGLLSALLGSLLTVRKDIS